MQTGSTLEDRLRARLAEIELNGLRRSLRAPCGIDLSSNDYLGLSKHPQVVARFMEGVAREGCGSTGSRLLRGQRNAFEAIERRFAAFKGAERALFFSSGYLANIAVLTALADTDDVVYWDEACHASLVDGVRLARARSKVFPHNGVTRLRQLLAGHGDADEPAPDRRAGNEPGLRFVVVESLFSMGGDFAPLADYAALCRSAGVVLVVDEAHAVGVYGARGSGLIEATGVGDAVCVSINTAGKALGVAGAFVAGPASVVEYLVQRARPFLFSTAPPPALADALDASLTIVTNEPGRRERLMRLAGYMRAKLAAAGLAVPSGPSQIVPILIGENAHAIGVAGRLQQEGFDARAIRPPSVPRGTARLRVSVNTELSEPTIDRFVAVLTAALEDAGLCSAASS
jgi:8-amino-7-oxononanoate synthase